MRQGLEALMATDDEWNRELAENTGRDEKAEKNTGWLNKTNDRGRNDNQRNDHHDRDKE